MENSEIKNIKYSTSDKKGVLGTLEGPCADTINATRNGRKYSDALWEKAFNDPIVNEYFACGGIFGELGHPEDRSETDMEKIAICMPEKPTKGEDGKLYGRWDILDTPNGRILKCLCDYGYKIGISSRGNGEVTEDWNGDETVEPDSYELNAFDAVLLPAVKEARLALVTESLTKDNFKVALQESLDKATTDARKIMEQTLDNLHIDYKKSNDSNSGQKESNVESKEDITADDDGANLMKNLQEALRNNRELQKNITTLNEKLSVSYAKETRLQRQCEKLQDELNVLSPQLDASQSLHESFKNAKKVISSHEVKLSEQREQINKLQEKLQISEKLANKMQRKTTFLEERLQKKMQTNSNLRNLVDELTKQLSEHKTNEASNMQLREDYQNLCHETQTNEKRLNIQLDEALEKQNKYKQMYQNAFNALIKCKAEMNNIDLQTLKENIKSIRSISELDTLCETLVTRKRNLSKLPFPISNEEIKVKANQNKKSTFYNANDEVDGLEDFL